MGKSFEKILGDVFHSFARYWDSFVLILPRIALAIVILAAFIFMASRLYKLLNKKLSGEAHDPLFVRFLAQLTKFVITVCGIILSLHTLGLSGIAAGLLAGAGISAFIIGFAFKDIAENFLAGLILAFNRPFKLSDTVKIDQYIGNVIALNFRTTHIKTFDEKDVFIPNSRVVKETLINLTRDGWVRLDFLAVITYEGSINKAIALIKKEIKQEENVPLEKDPFIVVEELTINKVNLRVYFWTATFDYKRTILLKKSKLIQRVKEALEQEYSEVKVA